MCSPTSELALAARLAGLLPALMLGACTAHDSVADGAEPIECKLAGVTSFERVCTLEKSQSPEGEVLTARAPGGGFRRFLVVRDGRGVIAADGAEEVQAKTAGKGSIDVTAGDMVWRLPARAK